MSMKKKFILMGICVAIILLLFTVNVIQRWNKSNKVVDPVEDVIVKEGIITRAEAYRLLSYLSFNKVQREALGNEFEYADENMSGWYDTYVNAVCNMGLIEDYISNTPKEGLTFGECEALFNKLSLKDTISKDLLTQLSSYFTKPEEEVELKTFLEMYQLIYESAEKKSITEKTLFVLGNEVLENEQERIVTDSGNYFFQHYQSYEKYVNDTQNLVESDVKGTFLDKYLDKGVKALICGQEIIYIAEVSSEKITLYNTWITKGEKTTVAAFVGGIQKSFETKFPLDKKIEGVIGDITIEDKKIVQVSVKPEIINGKVLLSGEDFVEVEGYGKVELDENYKIYKIYGELSLEATNSILVGYQTTDFVVSNGKISAALIKESIKAENIRVLLKNTNYDSVYHKKVEFTATTDFTVSYKDTSATYSVGDKVVVEPGDEILSEGRIRIEPSSENGKIQILSIERASGNPKYRGSIEIAEDENGLFIVNDLPLEEYLYAVIPSEMPTYYGIEPLKVQAVCARSYAYKHLLANSCFAYGAHVDDSVSYQVYNNIEENESSILAVKDTYGKVIEFEGDVITAYYFSTSCGHTSAIEHVWADGIETPYLNGKLMAVSEDGADVTIQTDNNSMWNNLSEDENFRSFLTDDQLTTYDSDFAWYRWNVTMDVDDIRKVIDQKLQARYNANSALVQILSTPKKKGQEAVYESSSIDTVGEILDISVLKREAGGIISELLITGSENSVKVKTEYNIRTLLAPTYDIVTRKDLSEVDSLELLPSAYFVIDKEKKDGKLKNITLIGGGYGHGVGMSQNGAKTMADMGMKYEKIIEYYYEGTELGFIYQ